LEKGYPLHRSNHRYLYFLTGKCLMLLLLLSGVGCSSENKGEAENGIGMGAKPLESAVPGGTAVIALANDPDALNPLLYTSSAAGMVYAEIHDGLTEMDEKLNYVPRIASDWKISPDRLSITYQLNRWRFSDGTPLTAFDVVHSYDLFVDPAVASPRRGRLREVERAVALDSFTVRYWFDRPQAEPLARTWHHVLPWHMIKDLSPQDVANWPINSHPLSSGEFELESWERNRSLVLKPNKEYPGVAPLLSRVVFQVLPEANTRVIALETGEVDLVAGLDPDAAERLAASGKIKIVSAGGRRFYYLNWNLANPVFADPRTRRALSLAIDRQLMVATLLKGYGAPATSPIPPVLWNHNDKIPAQSRDLNAARLLLNAAGWRDDDGDGILERNGTDLAFEIIARQGDPVRRDGAVILSAQLAEVGAKVSLRIMEHAASLSRVRSGNYDSYLGLLNANLFGNPAGYIASDATDQFNFGHYANSKVDSLLELASGEMEREKALSYWWQLQEVLQEDPPAAYLMYPDYLVGVSIRVQNVVPHLLSPVNNLARWWIAPSDRKYRTD
jgi:peptide/nickel transport system substrate-binding protein